MAFVTHQLLAETDTTVTVKFTSRNNKDIVRTFTKIQGMPTTDLLEVLRQRMVLKYIKGAQEKNVLKRTILEESDDHIIIRFDSRSL